MEEFLRNTKGLTDRTSEEIIGRISEGFQGKFLKILLEGSTKNKLFVEFKKNIG